MTDDNLTWQVVKNRTRNRNRLNDSPSTIELQLPRNHPRIRPDGMEQAAFQVRRCPALGASRNIRRDPSPWNHWSVEPSFIDTFGEKKCFIFCLMAVFGEKFWKEKCTKWVNLMDFLATACIAAYKKFTKSGTLWLDNLELKVST